MARVQYLGTLLHLWHKIELSGPGTPTIELCKLVVEMNPHLAREDKNCNSYTLYVYAYMISWYGINIEFNILLNMLYIRISLYACTCIVVDSIGGWAKVWQSENQVLEIDSMVLISIINKTTQLRFVVVAYCTYL